jgi:hypothetical protein
LARGLDHIVHAVHDLDAATETYTRLGFAVGVRNTHPRAWGTQNHIIQLPGTFIELLAVADETGIAPHAARHFSFGAFNRDFLLRQQGLSMLVLQGRGSADAEEFRSKGIGDFDLYEFEREGRRPDGSFIKVAFALAFAADPQLRDVGFFTCLHRQPENFWNPAIQKHANGVSGFAGVVLVVAKPADHLNFMQNFAGAAHEQTGDGFTIATPRGAIEVVTPTAFLTRFGLPAPDSGSGPRLAAMRFRGGLEKIEVAMGAVLVFER